MGTGGLFLTHFVGTGQSWLFPLSLFLSANICLNLPEPIRFQALGKGFEDWRVPEEGDRWCAHPGGQL